jgi:hypothetical protein
MSTPVAQSLADAYHAYLSARRMDDQIAAWAVFRALCSKQGLESVAVAKRLNPWRKS